MTALPAFALGLAAAAGAAPLTAAPSKATVQHCFDGLANAEQEAPADRIGLWVQSCADLLPICVPAKAAAAVEAPDHKRAAAFIDACRRAACPGWSDPPSICSAKAVSNDKVKLAAEWAALTSALVRREMGALGEELALRVETLGAPSPPSRWPPITFGKGVPLATRVNACLQSESIAAHVDHSPFERIVFVAMQCNSLWDEPFCRGALVRSPALVGEVERHARYVVASCRNEYCGAWPGEPPALCREDVAGLSAQQLLDRWMRFQAALAQRGLSEPHAARVAHMFETLAKAERPPLPQGTLSKVGATGAGHQGIVGLLQREPTRGHATGIDHVELDKKSIQRVIGLSIGKIRFCYERALTEKPTLRGKIVTRFVIGPDGNAADAKIESSTLGDTGVETCIAEVIDTLRFPAPGDTKPVIVEYPFIFTPVQ